ncbi:hypothetical protein IE81DRAFT_294973, partial [Ceraceosorus guamensis]
LILATIALFSRGFLSRPWASSVEIKGMERFLDILYDDRRRKDGRGILTYANHISVMDDPTIFGKLPFSTFQRQETTRWTLGAADIMFTNALFRYFFTHGQVLSTDRGRGVFQPSIDTAIDKLLTGQWVHIFPEGYVNMSRKAICRRFKWGIGRLLLESHREQTPIVIPIWIEGLDAMMPEPRNHPRWMPRPGANIKITFGDPVESTLGPLLPSKASASRTPSSPISSDQAASTVSMSDSRSISRASGSSVSDDISSFSSSIDTDYPAPTSDKYPPPTPLAPPPPGGYALPQAGSRSHNSLASGADQPEARLLRSRLAAALRARLLQLGEKSAGKELRGLVHTLMKEERIE